MLFILAIVIHTMMMQQLTLAEDFECTNCANLNCPSDYKSSPSSSDVFFHLQNFNSTLENDTSVHSAKDSQLRLNLKICCFLCKTRCTLSNGTIVNDGYEFQNPENPCEQLVCSNGTFSTHISLCRPLSCFKDHHVIKPGVCCPSCLETWANFCQNDDNAEDCEIVCDTKNGFGYKRDEKRDCDICSCSKIQTTRQTSSTTSTTESQPLSYDATGFMKHNFYFYPNQNLFFSLSIASSVVLVACIIGVVLYRKKVYKRVPSSISV